MTTTCDVAGLHDSVEQAVRNGRAGDLAVLGYGEISLVVAWPPGSPQWAAKRLPVFPDRWAVDAYAAVLDRYIDALRDRGVDVLETTLETVPGERGTVTAYLVQPALTADSLLPQVLGRVAPDPEHPLLVHVVDRVTSVVDERVGLDGQLANWATWGDRLVYFDLTTPLLRTPQGRWEVDGRLLAAAVPWALRPALVRLVIPSIVARYHDRRTVLLDVAVNLLRLRMDDWVLALLQASRRRAGVVLTAEQVWRDYRSEARTWGALQAVRRTDRVWQTRVRHRPYPFLIPDRTGW
jgi:hypothetical protein